MPVRLQADGCKAIVWAGTLRATGACTRSMKPSVRSGDDASSAFTALVCRGRMNKTVG